MFLAKCELHVLQPYMLTKANCLAKYQCMTHTSDMLYSLNSLLQFSLLPEHYPIAV